MCLGTSAAARGVEGTGRGGVGSQITAFTHQTGQPTRGVRMVLQPLLSLFGIGLGLSLIHI